MSKEVSAYARSLGLPENHSGQVQALRQLGVSSELIMPAIESVDRLPKWFRSKIMKAVESEQPAEGTVPPDGTGTGSSPPVDTGSASTDDNPPVDEGQPEPEEEVVPDVPEEAAPTEEEAPAEEAPADDAGEEA